MKSLSVFRKDAGTALKKPMMLLTILAVLFIPTLYSGVYLKAFWDPYGNLDKMPVAIVNEDKGADYEGTKLNAGQDLVEELKKSKDFNWVFVSREQAEEGLKKDEYYVAIIVPENFSANATTVLDDQPKPAQLIYEPKQGENFTASTIAGSAAKELKAKVSAKITEAYANSVFDNITDISNGLGEASDGAAKIADGAGQLDDGAAKLKNNLVVLTEGTGKLLNGVQPLKQGAAAIKSGAAELQTGGSSLASGLNQLSAAHKQLTDGAAQSAAGAKQLSGGLQQSAQGAAQLKGGAGAVADGSSRLKSGAESVADGSSKLQAGLTSSVDGSAKLADGLKASAEGSAKVSAGAKSVSDGLQQLAQANPQLAASADVQKLIAASKAVADGSAQLQQSQAQLAQGASDLHSGQEQLAQGATQVHDGAQKLAAGAGQLNSGALQLGDGAAQLAEGQQRLASGAASLATGGGKLAAGMQQFGAKLGSAAAGGSKLADGTAKLEAGASSLAAGVAKLGGGIGSVAEGSQKLSDGAGDLKDGTADLKTGSSELAGKLNDAADKTGGVKTTDETVSMFAEPVELNQETLSEVPNYGTGLAPYFLSLGLFVGSLMCTIVISLRSTTVEEASRFNRFASRTLIFSGMSLLQSLVVASIMLYGLRLEVQSMPRFYVFSFIASLSFMWLIQALVTWLDQPGRFVAIVLLIFQLTTSAGTFPLELIPKWMQSLHPLLPMSYSVQGFRSVISTGDYGRMWSDAGTLAIYGAVSLVFTLLYFISRGRDEKTELNSEQVLSV
ncbi:putative membrane protein [Paenibacillus sophorae]|uniref:Putative membrane protein n=1 Tax=Paenibacillus sophorae TaxID=1333845 RepID=A0A1H8TBQ5_9BACL|nr:YhgE/Pip domain-containing protein [Paenibacillus sophorae]QWU17179.1 YhgE/Pip domain-containing protein [Paenibacillus sophorae]SEO88176.1 putative membrane protein [Paenibacillus sophorae]